MQRKSSYNKYSQIRQRMSELNIIWENDLSENKRNLSFVLGRSLEDETTSIFKSGLKGVGSSSHRHERLGANQTMRKESTADFFGSQL